MPVRVVRGTAPPKIIGAELPSSARALGTRDDVRAVVAEPPLGCDWFYSLQMELLGRNLATAGGLETAYRLGRAHREFELIRPRRASVAVGTPSPSTPRGSRRSR